MPWRAPCATRSCSSGALRREARRSEKAKRLYYLSIEFLTGRWLHNNLLNLCSTKEYERAFEDWG